jgi:hypothetical protein
MKQSLKQQHFHNQNPFLGLFAFFLEKEARGKLSISYFQKNFDFPSADKSSYKQKKTKV